MELTHSAIILQKKWPVHGYQWHYFTTNSTNCTNELDRDFDSRCRGRQGKKNWLLVGFFRQSRGMKNIEHCNGVACADGVHPTMKCPSLFATDLNIWHVESVSSSSMSFNMSNGILLSMMTGTMSTSSLKTADEFT